MKIINFGSLNIDHVYQVDHIVRSDETIRAKQTFFRAERDLISPLPLRVPAQMFTMPAVSE